jgi:hypothetical protein
VLQDTAHRFTFGGAYQSDPQNPGGSTSFDKGAGLVDVPAALRALGFKSVGVSPDAVTITSGDGGDYPGPGANDIKSLTVANETDGLRYVLAVGNIEDVQPGAASTLRILQNVDGHKYQTDLSVTATGVTAVAASTAVPTQIVRDTAADTVSFLLPYATVGNPPQNAPAHNVVVLSYAGLVQDVAPGGLGATFNTAPEYGSPYTVKPVPIVDATPSPSPSASGSPTPEPSPSPTTPAVPLAPTTSYYLHSANRLNQVDQQRGGNAFDTVVPTANDSVSVDVPVGRGPLLDALWNGSVTGHISSLSIDVNYLAPAPFDAAFDITLESASGAVLATLPTLDIPPAQTPGRIQYTFEGLDVEASGPLAIRFATVYANAPAEILYDSAATASGFTINPNAAATPIVQGQPV